MKKELDSYKAGKPWREALPLVDGNKSEPSKGDDAKPKENVGSDSEKATADEKKSESPEKSAERKAPQKPDASTENDEKHADNDEMPKP